jgi:CRISPR-associated endonuclease/helicase Cas3
MAAAQALLDDTAEAQLAAMGLPTARWRNRFRTVVLSAAFCHDLGKANDQFQAMLRGSRTEAQAIRHEALSLLIVQQAPLRDWLAAGLGESEDLDFLLWATAGHHRKFPPGEPTPGSGLRLSLLLGHPDFHRTLGVGAKWLQLSEPPALLDESWQLTGMNSPSRRLSQAQLGAAAHWESCNEERRLFLAAVKACVIAADVAGSALPKSRQKISVWVRDALQRRPTPEQVEKVIADRLGGEPLRRFQKALGETSQRVVLAQAGCGSGKTLGAYEWARRRAPTKRLFFCYPTTGTATEGFRDYLIDPSLDAQLVHGRASVDLELLGVDDDGERLDPLAALDTWSTRIISCTVDTVLGLIQNQRRGLFAWPALADAAFVFDEIHAYDERLFSALLRFLASCRGLPCLLMTASLPRTKRAGLEQTLGALGERLEVVAGPADLEELPRYQHFVTEDPWPVVERTLAEGGKVLWVANTVDRSLAVADEARRRDLCEIMYHSRFRYEDRVRQHGRAIAAFRRDGPAMAVTTQVAEMSLDLSADLLVTDLAPIAALIQRLGRLNRRSTPAKPLPPKPFIIIEPSTEAPYKDEDHPAPFASAHAWLERLGTGALSQADLARTWAELDEEETCDLLDSAWLDGGFETTPRHLRETSPGIAVILQPDAAAVARGDLDPARVRIPMNPPSGNDWKKWREVAFARVPPPDRIAYDPERGAQWNR